jgi:hypothetical protein
MVFEIFRGSPNFPLEKNYFFRIYALQRQNTEISKQIFPEKEYRGLNPNFHIHASISDLYIPMISLPILLKEICRPILGPINGNDMEAKRNKASILRHLVHSLQDRRENELG